ncbi:MAG: hypothetical protein MHM6MM_006737 [Cercozoa sp. M6MM]
MCRTCILKPYPARGGVAHDTGIYVLNFAGCAKCGNRDPRRVRQLVHACDSDSDGDSDGEGNTITEEVQYDHVCQCDHLIAPQHFYSYVEGSRTHTMHCVLCGRGEHKPDLHVRATGTVLHLAAESERTEAQASSACDEIKVVELNVSSMTHAHQQAFEARRHSASSQGSESSWSDEGS